MGEPGPHPGEGEEGERGGHYSLLGEMTIKVHSTYVRSSILSSCTREKM